MLTETAALAAKLSLAQLAPMLASLVLARLVATHGADEFSAYSIVVFINVTGFIATTGFLQSLYYLCGQALGRQQPAAYGATLGAGLIWAAGLGVVCTVTSAVAGPSAALFGVAPFLCPQIARLGLIAACGLLPGTLLMVLRVHATMQGGAGLVTFVYAGGGVAAMAAAAALQYFGAAGVLWGITGVNWLMLAAMLAALRHKRLHLPRLTAGRAALRAVFATGWPTGAIIFLDSMASLISVMIVARYWLAATPLHACVLLCINVGLVGPLGLAQACIQRVSILHAQGDVGARDRCAWLAIRMAGAYGGIGAVLLGALGPQICSALGLSVGGVSAGLLHRIVLLGGVVLACQSVIVVAASALRGLGEARAPLVQAVIGYGVVAAGSELLFGVWLGGGLAGVWLGLAAGFAATAAALLRRCTHEFGPAFRRWAAKQPTCGFPKREETAHEHDQAERLPAHHRRQRCQPVGEPIRG
jgi:Na+-driven multidrug efflux pump